MKHLIISFVFLSSFLAIGQGSEKHKPDYSEIEKIIKDPDSQFYYPKLMEKFNKIDSTMTLEERRNLYYGYSFQKGYSFGYKSNELIELEKIVSKENIIESDYTKILIDCDAILKQNPFDLRALNYERYVYEKKNEKDNNRNKIAQIRIIVNAIVSSGDGTSKENAFYVINSEHCYDMLSLLGYKYEGENKPLENSLYLKVKENDKKIEGIYFDLTPALKSYNELIDKEKKEKSDVIGTWKIVDVVEQYENKHLQEFIKGLKQSYITLNKDMSFHFTSKDKSKGILEFIKMLGTTNWVFIPKENLISVGTKKDNYSLMKFKMIQKAGTTFFSIQDDGMKLNLVVVKQ